MRLALLFLAACGASPMLQPNTVTACKRAIECEAITPDDESQCVNCLEHIDQEKLQKLQDQYGPLPPLDKATCEQISAALETDIGQCIRSDWTWKL